MSEQHPIVGKIITDAQYQDAIHVAIAPVVASMELEPGQHVTLDTYGEAVLIPMGKKKGLGIVDPFLTTKVNRGQKFWLFLYPNTITSLRHKWSHPAFQTDELSTPDPDKLIELVSIEAKLPMSESIRWITEYAESIGLSFDDLMDAADDYINTGHYLSQGDLLEGVYTDNEFWPHYEVVRGKKVQRSDRSNFFSCSC